MTTMKQIAEMAGVSVSTVSLVINKRDKGRVNPGLARRVRKTADALGYHPNPLARSLRTSRTRILGFISEEIATTPYAGNIIRGAQDAASATGYMMLTVNTDGTSKKDEEQEVATLKRYGVDGFLYAKMYNRLAQVPDCLQDQPLVLVDATDESGSVPSISPDEFHIGYDATRHLIEAGCERIAYIGAAETLLAQGIRLQGYRAALEESGRTFVQDLVANVGFNQPALDQVGALFDSQHPDGFFCFNDARAWHVYEAAARRGLTVGRDISVVGVDNHRLVAETISPRLTTIELPHYEIGYWSVCKLVSMITGEPVPEDRLPDTIAPLPSMDAPWPVRIRCTLLSKDSVVPHNS
ncbi:LacI family transcriptional regulator [Bifidobacterium aemilianum]|uniref:LacI family transcriptional regulator n=1 Tax=Bifidobacterium aemilianum TaxID=2493120 RepID=A0A366KDE3_9BIFI|nr:LacI family DNA-binding transcriptional regulator [Bifidobacterium aemilianum]RBP98691.1 LacI family transcriptional regulator [Bifidobacterium aemilianum]